MNNEIKHDRHDRDDPDVIEIDLILGTLCTYAFDPYSRTLMRAIVYYCPGCDIEYLGLLSYTVEISNEGYIDKACPYCQYAQVKLIG